MGENNIITKVAITGNTLLTLKCMERIIKLQNYRIISVFGLPKEKLKTKVNSIDLTDFCIRNNIKLFQTDNWDQFYNFCKKEDIDKIITLGDSRIIPKKIVNSFDTIGNHGAILPAVQGGASLVWGRLLNDGEWGISIMKIGEKVDSGDILKVKKFNYEPNITEENFTTIADNLTVEALIDVLMGDYLIMKNKRWAVRVAKHTDSFEATAILKFCKDNKLPVYMPSRTPDDGIVDDTWPLDFISVFKIANNFPYPKWREK